MPRLMRRGRHERRRRVRVRDAVGSVVLVGLVAGLTVTNSRPPPAATGPPSTPPVVSVAGVTAVSTAPVETTIPVETAVPVGPTRSDAEPPARVRIALVGDIMLGRGVAPMVASDPYGVFADVRPVLEAADIAGGNLESPLTLRPHISANPNNLTAHPSGAAVLAAAGFDVMGVANNHSGDAGRESVTDTVEAVETAGMAAVGGGSDLAEALAAEVVVRGGVRVAFLAFDATLAGWPAGETSPGIARWDHAFVEAAVAEARRVADLVVVSVHGGAEYLTASDPDMVRLASALAGWGVDVVWGHGPHVVQPVYVEGETLVATSLGNFIFDQRREGTRTGLILEVLADSEGVIAYRLGLTDHSDRRVHLLDWVSPAGPGVVLGGEQWTAIRTGPSRGGPHVD